MIPFPSASLPPQRLAVSHFFPLAAHQSTNADHLMIREIEKDLLQDLQWNGEILERREELRNHFSLLILEFI